MFCWDIFVQSPNITIKVVDTFCRDAGIPAYMYLAISPGNAAPQCGNCDYTCMAALPVGKHHSVKLWNIGNPFG